MSERISCPGCKRVLRLPPDCTDPWLSCPLCLAKIRNPQAEGVAEHPREERPAGQGEEAPRDRTCPSCGAAVERRWMICPFCEATLRRRRRRRRRAGADVDARRDISTTGVVMILLAVLGGIGITVALVTSFAALGQNEAGPLFVTLAFLFVLALVSTAIVLGRAQHSEQPTAARIVVGTLSLAGILIAGSCVLSVAGFIFLLAVCLAG
jgi:hypothetical protein